MFVLDSLTRSASCASGSLFSTDGSESSSMERRKVNAAVVEARPASPPSSMVIVTPIACRFLGLAVFGERSGLSGPSCTELLIPPIPNRETRAGG